LIKGETKEKCTRVRDANYIYHYLHLNRK